MEIKELYDIYRQHPCVTTDSRNCPAGSIFLALKGISFNGNKFAEAALENGCSYAIIDEEKYKKDDRYILVGNGLDTYQALAREHRRQFNIPVIGITGTNGKTTTKELIAAVLSEKYNVLFTEGNFNNDVGVPKTLLRLDKYHEIAIIEMGASHPGDIKRLADTAEPGYGIITNVGKAHLQGFGTFDGVKRTKGELYDFLKTTVPRHPIFINADNEHLIHMAGKRGITEMVKYGQKETESLAVRGETISCAPFLKFRWRTESTARNGASDWHEVQTHIIGTYNTDNMLAAITVGNHFCVTSEQINHALENYIPTNNRSQITITENNRLIADAYNANPTSMNAAIENFRRMEVSPKMAILGEMGELGTASRKEHDKIVEQLLNAGFDTVWLVGNEFYKTRSGFRTFENAEEVKAAIKAENIKGQYILIKGSHSTRLYELPEIL